jgi:hypothetical protein
MAVFRCEVNTGHGITDQVDWIGCRSCVIERCASTNFITAKHQLTSATTRVSLFALPSTASSSSAGSCLVTFRPNPSDLAAHLRTAPLKYNVRHKTGNVLLPGYQCGVYRSSSTSYQQCDALLVVKVLTTDTHGYPVQSTGSHLGAVIDWPYHCACGSLKEEGAIQCRGCEQVARR